MMLSRLCRVVFLVLLLVGGIASGACADAAGPDDWPDKTVEVSADNSIDSEDRVVDHTPRAPSGTFHPILGHVARAIPVQTLNSRIGDPPLRPPSNT